MPHAASVWLDCDPGHDDAIALLLACHHPDIELCGVSTVAGNAPGAYTFVNAARLLCAFSRQTEHLRTIPLLRGADEPLLRPPRKDAVIHGEDGLGGVIGLPAVDSEEVRARMWHSYPPEMQPRRGIPPTSPDLVVQSLAALIRQRQGRGDPPLSICITGPCTNIALFVKLHSDLLCDVKQIVLMGGSAGAAGNRGPLAEFNILVDPEAAAIVFDADVKVVMAGLNVTHQAIYTAEIDARLVRNASPADVAAGKISTLRRLLSSALNFFADSYASEFGFVHGPPVHDMLVIAYLIDPSLFYTAGQPTTAMGPMASTATAALRDQALERLTPPKRYRVRVECGQSLAVGATVVDFYNSWGIEHEGWGRGGRNVEVLEELDRERLWSIFLSVVDRAEDALV